MEEHLFKDSEAAVSGARVLCFTSETGLDNLDNAFIMHFLVFRMGLLEAWFTLDRVQMQSIRLHLYKSIYFGLLGILETHVSHVTETGNIGVGRGCLSEM